MNPRANVVSRYSDVRFWRDSQRPGLQQAQPQRKGEAESLMVQSLNRLVRSGSAGSDEVLPSGHGTRSFIISRDVVTGQIVEPYEGPRRTDAVLGQTFCSMWRQ